MFGGRAGAAAWRKRWNDFLKRMEAILDRRLRRHFVRIAIAAAQSRDDAALKKVDAAVKTIIAHQVMVKNEVSKMALDAAAGLSENPPKLPDGTPWKRPPLKEYHRAVNEASLAWRGARASLIVNAVHGVMRRAKETVGREMLAAKPDATVAEIRIKIESTVARNAKSAAAVAALTETHAASMAAQEAATRALGVPIAARSWISTSDNRTRPTHRAADGQRQPDGHPFQVGGFSLMMPGDSSLGAPPEETVNCRCGVIYEVARK